MFSRTERCGSSARSRSAGTSTSPARIASYGCRALSARPPMRIWPESGVSSPESTSNSSSWPCPSSAAMPRISPERSVNETSCTCPADRDSTSSAAGPSAAEGRTVSASRSIASPAARAASGPSMYSTIRSSPPSWGTIVATAVPSRRIVARSQVAITSFSRCVMKRTERPCSRRSDITAKTRSARSDGSAAVISSSSSSSGSRASARARSIMRSSGNGRSPVSSVKSTARSIDPSCRLTAPASVPVRRRFCATVRSGTSAGSWKTGARPTRAARAGERTRNSLPRTAIVPPSPWITPVGA